MKKGKNLKDGILVLGLSGTGKTSYLCGLSLAIQKGGFNQSSLRVHVSGGDRLGTLGKMPVVPASKFLADTMMGHEGETFELTDPESLPRVLHLFRVHPRRFAGYFDLWTADMPGETWHRVSGQRNMGEETSETQAEGVQIVRELILPRTSAFILLVDLTAAESSAYWQTQWFEEIYQQTDHLAQEKTPVPLSVVLTKVDLLLDGNDLHINLPQNESLYYQWLKKRNELHRNDAEITAGRISYCVSLQHLLDPQIASEELEAISWDMLHVQVPAVYDFCRKYAADPRFDISVYAVSAWGHDLPVNQEGFVTIPPVDSLSPTHVEKPVERIIQTLTVKKKAVRRYFADLAAAIILLLALLLGPGFFHGMVLLGDWFAGAGQVEAAGNIYKVAAVHPYHKLLAVMAPAVQRRFGERVGALSEQLLNQRQTALAASLTQVCPMVSERGVELKAKLAGELLGHAVMQRDVSLCVDLLKKNMPSPEMPTREIEEEINRAVDFCLEESHTKEIRKLLETTSPRVHYGEGGNDVFNRWYHRSLAAVKEQELPEGTRREDIIARTKSLSDVWEISLGGGDAQQIARVRGELVVSARKWFDLEKNYFMDHPNLSAPKQKEFLVESLSGIVSVVRIAPELESDYRAARELMSGKLMDVFNAACSKGDVEACAALEDLAEQMATCLKTSFRPVQCMRARGLLAAAREHVKGGRISDGVHNIEQALNICKENSFSSQDRNLSESAGNLLAVMQDFQDEQSDKAQSGEQLASLLGVEIGVRTLAGGEQLAGAVIAQKQILYRLNQFLSASGQSSGLRIASQELSRAIAEARDLSVEDVKSINEKTEEMISSMVGDKHYGAAEELLDVIGPTRFRWDAEKEKQKKTEIYLNWAAAATGPEAEEKMRKTCSLWENSLSVDQLKQAMEKASEVCASNAENGPHYAWEFAHEMMKRTPAKAIPSDVIKGMTSLALGDRSSVESFIKNLSGYYDTLQEMRRSLSMQDISLVWRTLHTYISVNTDQNEGIETLLSRTIDFYRPLKSQEASRYLFSEPLKILQRAYLERNCSHISVGVELCRQRLRWLEMFNDNEAMDLFKKIKNHVAGLDSMILLEPNTGALPFYISKQEVMVGEYRRFLEAPASDRRSKPAGMSRDYIPEQWQQQSDSSASVCGVDWYDADAFCKWAGGALPTEQQWRWAAFHGDSRRYPWGSREGADSVELDGAMSGSQIAQTSDVTGEGVLCLGGGVKEWINLSDSRFGYTMGGSWSTTLSGARSDQKPRSYSLLKRQDDIGFRVAKPMVPPEVIAWLKKYTL